MNLKMVKIVVQYKHFNAMSHCDHEFVFWKYTYIRRQELIPIIFLSRQTKKKHLKTDLHTNNFCNNQLI